MIENANKYILPIFAVLAIDAFSEIPVILNFELL